MNVNFEQILTEAEFFLKNNLRLQLNSILFLQFVKHIDIHKKEKNNRLLFYFENFFKKIIKNSSTKYLSVILMDFSDYINNYLIEYIFEELDINKKLLEDIDTRKSVVFSILLSFYTTMNSYEEILNFSNSIFSFKKIEQKILELIDNDYNNLMSINFDKILGKSDNINYLNDIHYISRLAISNNYHNYLKLRQNNKNNSKYYNLTFIKSINDIIYIYENRGKYNYVGCFFENTDNFYSKLF